MSDPQTDHGATLRQMRDSLQAERDAEQAQLEWQGTRGTEMMQRIIRKLTAEVDALNAALAALDAPPQATKGPRSEGADDESGTGLEGASGKPTPANPSGPLPATSGIPPSALSGLRQEARTTGTCPTCGVTRRQAVGLDPMPAPEVRQTLEPFEPKDRVHLDALEAMLNYHGANIDRECQAPMCSCRLDAPKVDALCWAISRLQPMVLVTCDGRAVRLPAKIEWSALGIWCPWGDMHARDLWVNGVRVGKWGETPYNTKIVLNDGDTLLSVPQGRF